MTSSNKHIIVLKEKYGERYIEANTPEQRGIAACRILRERIANKWYNEHEAEMAQMVLDLTDVEKRYERAWSFLSKRNGYEYEGIEIVSLETASGE
jgi:ABC-type glutathione transport system ATPase component